VNVLDTLAAQEASTGADPVRSLLLRTAEPMVAKGRRGLGSAAAPPSQADSLYSDPVYIRNALKLIPNRDRIIGGIPTSLYSDCVAVGSDNGWCCTGTLVSPNVVVSAAHCVGGCSTRVFVGEDVNDPDAGTVLPVAKAVAHPDYRRPNPVNDIAVLILAEDAACKPRAMAPASAMKSAASVRLAGFGNTDVNSVGGYGRRRMVDVPLASDDPRYGADASTEFVAGAPFLDRDSCNGDSGGPAYVQSRRKWYLAGATSRATASSVRPCGDGGIYTRISSFEAWIRSVPGGHWKG